MKQCKLDACLRCGTAVTQRCPAGTPLKVCSPSSWTLFAILLIFLFLFFFFFCRSLLRERETALGPEPAPCTRFSHLKSGLHLLPPGQAFERLASAHALTPPLAPPPLSPLPSLLAIFLATFLLVAVLSPRGLTFPSLS